MENNIRVAQFADGSINEVEMEIEGEPESVIIFRDGEGVRAWLNVCPHAGRRLDYAPGEFLRTPGGLLMCAVHGATFSLTDGQCVGGPCVGAHLRALRVETNADGTVLIAAGADPRA